MLQLKALYTIDAPVVPLTEWVLRADWFTEIAELEWSINHELLETLEADGRLNVRRLVEKYHDHRRSASMHSIWFDGVPVMLVQNAGREGDDHKARWITDGKTFETLCFYLRSRLSNDTDTSDLADPDAFVYEEEILCFYSEDFTAQFGYQCEPRTPGYQVFVMSDRILPGLSHDQCLVEAKDGLDMPQYIRRGAYVLQKERLVTEEEHAFNPRIREVGVQQGYTQAYVYRACKRPENAQVVSV